MRGFRFRRCGKWPPARRSRWRTLEAGQWATVIVLAAVLAGHQMLGTDRTSDASPASKVFEPDKDCADFITHAEAQTFFEMHRPGDPYHLDADGDGIACERLP
jgi:hypothetical protein